MKITTQSQYPQYRITPQFKGLLTSKCANLNIYKIEDNFDLKFVKDLEGKINFESLMPGLSKSQYSRWHEMLEYAVYNASNPNNITYIATSNNKVCGIITYFPDKTTSLDCICTWPVEVGKKVKFGGKALFRQVFEDFFKQNGTRMKLEAITNGPFDTISKYEPLGFHTTSDIYPTKVVMEANKYKIKESLDFLNGLLHYKKVPPKKVNLRELEI